MRLMVLACFALVLAAGCSGNTNDTSTSGAGTGTDTGTSGTGGSGGNGTAPGMGSWHEEAVTGSFESTPGVAFGAAGAIIPFTVPENATDVWFNVTITSSVPSGTAGTEFEVDFHDPDHANAGDAPQGTAVTSGGKASVHVPGPTTGDWTMSLFSNYSPNQGSYDLRVNSYA